MMLITKECDYAVRILRALSKSTIASVQNISAEENIPVQYTYKICRKLSKAGILKSHRGSSGGYELRSNIKEITLFDVFLAVEADLQVSDCTQAESLCTRNTDDHPCKVHTELCRLQHLINSEFKSKKLTELF